MTIALELRGDARDVLRDLERFQVRNAPRIVNRALDSSARKVERAIRDELHTATSVPKSRISWIYDTTGARRRRRLRRNRATRKTFYIPRHTVRFVLAPTVIPLAALGRARETRAGVSVGKFRRPRAFLAETPRGDVHAFRRRSDARLPIDLLTVDLLPHWPRALGVAEQIGAREFLTEATRLLKADLERRI